jgi:hypothetical protein
MHTVAPAASAAQPAASEAAPRSSFPRRAADLFFTPGRLFAELRDDGRAAAWVAPLAAALLVVAAVEALRWVLVTDRQLAEAALAQMSRMNTSGPRPTLEQMEQGAVFSRIAIMVGAFVSTAIWPLFLAAVSWLLFTVLGGRAGYGRHLAVAAWASLVGTVGYAFTSGLQFASGRLDLQLDLALLAPGASPVLAGVLHALSPWMVWMLLLVAFGGSVVAGRRGWAAPAAALLALCAAFGLAAGMVAAAI